MNRPASVLPAHRGVISISRMAIQLKGTHMDASAWPDGPLLAGAISIVMGGSTGIGLAAARCLARHGSAVELAAIDEASVTAAVEQIRVDGHEAHGTVLDVARPEQVQEFFAAVQARHRRLSALVNSAGIQRYGTAETTPVAVWDEVLDVN